MTQVHQRPTDTAGPSLDHLLQLARDRSARGNASRRDWERVAEIDPDIAYRELRDFLRRTAANEDYAVNPYERRSGAPGAALGFVVGTLLMAALWVILPYARENWMDFGIWRDIATGGQFISTLLVPAGVLLGARWSRSRRSGQHATSRGIPQDATFEDLLEMFARTQNVGRARVY